MARAAAVAFWSGLLWFWIPADAGMTAAMAVPPSSMFPELPERLRPCHQSGNVLALFLTVAATLAISLRIPARRGARSRGVADAGRGTVLCWARRTLGDRRPCVRLRLRSPPKRTVRERPVGSLTLT